MIEYYPIVCSETESNKIPREHQILAFQNLDNLNKRDSFSTLLVLPTGGGKTYTACTWLLRNAIEKGYKVLWLAHRTFLLDQALETFNSESNLSNLSKGKEYHYRIVSGDKSRNHDYANNISRKDQLLLVSKDSIRCNLDKLENWCKDEVIYFIIDEAHHATAKTYRTIIDCVEKNAKHVKLLGLTATPTRTAEKEKGLLQKIFTDDIVFKEDLNNLINNGFLSKPKQITIPTKVDYGSAIGIDMLKRINRTDFLPEDLMSQIAASHGRNELIVNTYLEHKDEFGKTIVFALGQSNAASLCTLFNANHIKADFVISNMRSEGTGITISSERNKKVIDEFKTGDLDVLINVNILTDGVDVPNTQTVFLTRPTISEILMTQMVGRALRGVKSGGTEYANIVSFFDNWDNKVAWVNPSTVLGEDADFDEKPNKHLSRELKFISLAKLDEYVRILHGGVDAEQLESVPFIERIPVGMYIFSYELENNGTDKSCQILVYEHKFESYERLKNNISNLVNYYGYQEKEFLTEYEVSKLAYECIDCFFYGIRMLDFEKDGLIDIINYYIQNGEYPNYYPLEDIDRNKLDISAIARYIVENNMTIYAQDEYIKQLWNKSDNELIRMFFTNMKMFVDSIELEVRKLRFPEFYKTKQFSIQFKNKSEEDMSLFELKMKNPVKYNLIVEHLFCDNAVKYGVYTCPCCNKKYKGKRFFQIDHIKPLSKGGKTEYSNLQILCSSCNMRKRDKFETNEAPIEKLEEEMTISELKQMNPVKYEEIEDSLFSENRNKYYGRYSTNTYTCPKCHKSSNLRSFFNIVHRKQLSDGGKTELKNLQIICEACYNKLNKKVSEQFQNRTMPPVDSKNNESDNTENWL